MTIIVLVLLYLLIGCLIVGLVLRFGMVEKNEFDKPELALGAIFWPIFLAMLFGACLVWVIEKIAGSKDEKTNGYED